MQFLDEVRITLTSGKGGDGVVSARRESGVPFGGPAGGNGGHGGSIVFKASKDENTLLAYKYKKKFTAKAGEPGRSKEQFGANAEDLVLIVPVGTFVKDADSDRVLYHFTQDGEQWIAVRGGEGGIGNMMFKDSVHQYPNFALYGEPGQQLDLILELQLFADVALIGTPSVGKSSIINTISNTKAKVADYHFTTLIPHLGSVTVQDHKFNVVDVPGLVEGAAEGKGLGNAFLRHVLKARVLCIVTDISRYDQGITEAALLLSELKQYIQERFTNTTLRGQDIDEIGCSMIPDEKNELIQLEIYSLQGKRKTILLHKHIQFLCNKQDLVIDEDIIKEYTHALRSEIQARSAKNKFPDLSDNILFHNTYIISAATHHGIESWLEKLARSLTLLPAEADYLPTNEDIDIYHEQEEFVTDITEQEKPILIEKEYIDPVLAKYSKVRYVSDPFVSKLVYQMPWSNDEAEMRFWKTLEQRGIINQLEEAGVQKNDILKIKSYYNGAEDKHILY